MPQNEIIKKIARDFRVNVRSNTAIRPLQKKMLKGTATYLDADHYALETAKALGKALADNLVDDTLSAAEYRAIISEVLPAGLEATYNTVSTFSEAVQRGLNERAKIGLKVVVPSMDSESVVALTTNAARAVKYSEAAAELNPGTMNFAQNVATKMMKDNAGFQQNVGYNIIVERKYDDVGVHNRKDPCQWCLDKEGVWEYDDALSNGVFERHPGCGCTIIYRSEKGPQIQTDWRSNTWEYL